MSGSGSVKTPQSPLNGRRGRGVSRHLLRRLAVLWFVFILPVSAQPQTKFDPPTNRIKAAFVYNFCKFVEWPTKPVGNLVVGVVGDAAVNAFFDSIDGKIVRGTPITVHSVGTMNDLVDCHVVYVAAQHSIELETLLEHLDGLPVLTVSDIDGFCERGGMIRLVQQRGKLRFNINRGTADRAHLSISSQLLKMATLVEEVK